MTSALLVLEDGRWFAGHAVGAPGETLGEVIFNTSHTGYQEILTDPSYAGQIVVFTAPEIGNYGVCAADAQAERPRLAGLVVRRLSAVASSWRAEGDLPGWLVTHGVVGIAGVDTRALTRHIRERGALRAGIFAVDDAWSARSAAALVAEQLLPRVRSSPSLVGRDLASTVSCELAHEVGCGTTGRPRARVAVIDFGVKRGILAALVRRGLALTVLPAATPAEQILGRFDGVVLSNGPGDPEPVTAGIATARALIGRLPLLGICLGHQVLALALGARTYKMRFGHHGGNHPVRDQSSERGEVWITAQNHGFAVDPATLPAAATATHVSLYDGSLEGFCVPGQQLIAVQFHPEGAPGPSDAQGVFDRFVALLPGSEHPRDRERDRD